MVVTAHWIDEYWTLHNISLEFRRFVTPHTGDAACAFLKDVISTWDLDNEMQSVTKCIRYVQWDDEVIQCPSSITAGYCEHGILSCQIHRARHPFLCKRMSERSSQQAGKGSVCAQHVALFS